MKTVLCEACFTRSFGTGPGRVTPELGRYLLLGSVGCGWARRQRIALRLLGLTDRAKG